ncbi:MAG: hypothetical protein WD768_03285 [Phycisphaeraceae bacterium]
MKLAILSESEADGAALQVLVESLLGRPTELIRPARRARGYNQVLQIFESVYKELHFRSDAEALIVVVDSDDSLLPDAAPHAAEAEAARIAILKAIVGKFLPHLSPRPHAPPLRVAMGVAAPAIEAWLLSATDPRITEAAWIQGARENRPPYTRVSLKERMYGTRAPSLTLETQRMVEAARRVNIANLEDRFPHGFGPLARAVRAWETA